MNDSLSYSNPYTGQNFIGFFITLLQRISGYFLGNLQNNSLATDEIQLIVLIGVAACAGMVGTFLVLRKMTMMANAISHTILVGIVLAYFATHTSIETIDNHGPINIEAMLLASLGMGILTVVLTQLLTRYGSLQEDASIGIVFTTLFALGIVLVTLLTRNTHVGSEVIMGNVDSLNKEDGKLVFWVMGLNLLLLLLFFKEFAITAFDAGLASALGISTLFFNFLLVIQTSATIVGALRAVGVLMVLTFIVAPPLIARWLTDNLTSTRCRLRPRRACS